MADKAKKEKDDPKDYVKCPGCGNYIHRKNIKKALFGGKYCPACKEDLDIEDDE